MTIDHVDALFDRNYMRWYDLNGQPALIEIVGVPKQEELTLPGGRKARKPVLQFKQIKGEIQSLVPERKSDPPKWKPLVLNSTNANAIADIHGVKPSQWAGKQVVLYQDVTRMWSDEKKAMIDAPCIRVRAAKGN